MLCEMCDGSGNINGYICPTCTGNGHIEDNVTPDPEPIVRQYFGPTVSEDEQERIREQFNREYLGTFETQEPQLTGPLPQPIDRIPVTGIHLTPGQSVSYTVNSNAHHTAAGHGLQIGSHDRHSQYYTTGSSAVHANRSVIIENGMITGREGDFHTNNYRTDIFVNYEFNTMGDPDVLPFSARMDGWNHTEMGATQAEAVKRLRDVFLARRAEASRKLAEAKSAFDELEVIRAKLFDRMQCIVMVNYVQDLETGEVITPEEEVRRRAAKKRVAEQGHPDLSRAQREVNM